jgi:Carboxypeptidase regulatory-like domain
MSRSLRTLAPLLTLALAALFATAASGQTSPSESSPFSITGIVVSTTTGAPVPHCRLVPTRIEGGPASARRFLSQQDGVETDERGHFVMPLPSAGSWSLRASAKGYRPQFFDQHENFSTSIVLTEQVPTLDIRFRLAPDSVITGVILDEGNEPVREAGIAVYAVPRASADGAQPSVGRGSATTDDRGRYEVASLAPGDYRISVQARPWYAVAARSIRSSRPDTPPLEPSLDVVYPVTWFPGATNDDSAEIVTLHDGETREADMQLLPIPAVHLRIPVPPADPAAPDANRRSVRYPQISSVSPNTMLSGSTFMSTQDQLEVSGLSPGLYRIQTPDENGQPGRSTIIEVTANSARNLDLAAAANTATVNLKIEGGPGTESLPITFADATNDRNVFRSVPSRNGGGPQIQGRPQVQNGPQQNSQRLPKSGSPTSRSTPQTASDRSTRTVDLPPGRYFVYQGGSANFFLSGLTLGTKEILGRMVTIPSGESSLTVHIATGRSSVTGIATLNGRPAVGAMVLLVPITVGEPGSIAELRRDQTNTDGSFDLTFVIPGQYILIAIDRGWNINWGDPSTLSHYLSRGIPLDLRTPSILRQNIDAHLP